MTDVLGASTVGIIEYKNSSSSTQRLLAIPAGVSLIVARPLLPNTSLRSPSRLFVTLFRLRPYLGDFGQLHRCQCG